MSARAIIVIINSSNVPAVIRCAAYEYKAGDKNNAGQEKFLHANRIGKIHVEIERDFGRGPRSTASRQALVLLLDEKNRDMDISIRRIRIG